MSRLHSAIQGLLRIAYSINASESLDYHTWSKRGRLEQMIMHLSKSLMNIEGVKNARFVEDSPKMTIDNGITCVDFLIEIDLELNDKNEKDDQDIIFFIHYKVIDLDNSFGFLSWVINDKSKMVIKPLSDLDLFNVTWSNGIILDTRKITENAISNIEHSGKSKSAVMSRIMKMAGALLLN